MIFFLFKLYLNENYFIYNLYFSTVNYISLSNKQNFIIQHLKQKSKYIIMKRSRKKNQNNNRRSIKPIMKIINIITIIFCIEFIRYNKFY